MHQWRVTKYDPRRRDREGHFPADDWTAVSDMGGKYNGQILTVEKYLVVETAYVDAALRFFEESRCDALTVVGLEGDGRDSLADDPTGGIGLERGLTLREGQRVSGAVLGQTIRLNLRSLVWCKLEEPGRFFLHFGHDYYMYVGSDSPSSAAIEFARQIGLFVEPKTSPHRETPV